MFSDDRQLVISGVFFLGALIIISFVVHGLLVDWSFTELEKKLDSIESGSSEQHAALASNQQFIVLKLLEADQNLLNAIVVLGNQNVCGQNVFIEDQNFVFNEVPRGVIYRCFAPEGS